MPITGQVSITPPGGEPRPCWIDVGEDSLAIVPDGGAPVLLPFVDIDDLHDDDYTLRLTAYTGTRYDLTMLGKAYGQVLADVTKRRNDMLQHDLLLTGVGLQDTYPGKQLGGEGAPARRDQALRGPAGDSPRAGSDVGAALLVRRGRPVRPGALSDARPGRRRFRARLRDAWSAFRGVSRGAAPAARRAARTARTLSELLPGLPPRQLSELAGQIRDGRAVQQRAVDAMDPSLWERLEDVVVGTQDLRSSYGRLAALPHAGGRRSALSRCSGTTRRGNGRRPESPEQQDPGEENDEGHDRPQTIMWFFTPLSREGHPVNLVAHEITSEQGHATYLYRLMDQARFDSISDGDEDALADEVATGIRGLDRALLTLNFRREPIYLPEDQIQTGRFGRYRVALRKLEHLRWAREAFVTRLIHNEPWEGHLEEALDRA